MYLIFDCETAGLITMNTSGPYRYPSFRHLNKFDSARIVSISWLLADKDGKLIKQAYHILRPLDFIIDNNSKAVEIHGITQEIATEQGINWHDMYDEFIEDVHKCDTLVAHNIQFDVSIMLSEMFRYNKQDGITEFLSKRRLCTMRMGKKAMESKKNPKLSELYKFFFNEEMQNAHNASYDTLFCQQCFEKMLAMPHIKEEFVLNV